MTSPIPPYASQKFGVFPDAEYLPKAVRADVAKLLNLRTKALEARDAAHQALAAIDVAEADAVKAAADKLANGEDCEPEVEKVTAARETFEQAVRTLKATEQALTQVESRLMILFKANVDESHELAAGVLDDARAEYTEALDKLAAARIAYYRAASIEVFSHEFDSERPPAIVGYTQRIPDDGPTRVLRAELGRAVINTQPGPGLNARPAAASAPAHPGTPAGMVFH